MALTLSPPIVSPTVTVAMTAFDQGTHTKGARAASVPLVLGPSQQSVIVSTSNLQPQLAFGAVGSLYVDNTMNTTASVTITFPDSGAAYTIEAGGAEYLVAVTGAQQFYVASAVTALTQISLQIMNRVVGPTAPSPASLVAGGMVAGGSLSWANPGGTWQQLVPVLVNRRYLSFQMPSSTGGFMTFDYNGGSPTSMYHMQAYEKYASGLFVPNNSVYLNLDTPPANGTLIYYDQA